MSMKQDIELGVFQPRSDSFGKLVDEDGEDSSSSSSSKDEPRIPMLWQTREEKLINTWRVELFALSAKHGVEGNWNQRLYAGFGLPSCLLPVLSTQFEDDHVVLTMLLALSAACIGISTFLNFGKAAATHYEAESRYETLARNIDRCMSLPKKNRPDAGLFIEKTLNKYNSLNANSPTLTFSGLRKPVASGTN
jgi:hypothetical protein